MYYTYLVHKPTQTTKHKPTSQLQYLYMPSMPTYITTMYNGEVYLPYLFSKCLFLGNYSFESSDQLHVYCAGVRTTRALCRPHTALKTQKSPHPHS